jgi:hypothetical protein
MQQPVDAELRLSECIAMRDLVVFVDVDDTLVRSAGTKLLPNPRVIEHVRSLFADGAELYCWSTGGGVYAKTMAERLGIADCFRGFLPKPHLLIDDQPVPEWRRLITVHPLNCGNESAADYLARLDKRTP